MEKTLNILSSSLKILSTNLLPYKPTTKHLVLAWKLRWKLEMKIDKNKFFYTQFIGKFTAASPFFESATTTIIVFF